MEQWQSNTVPRSRRPDLTIKTINVVDGDDVDEILRQALQWFLGDESIGPSELDHLDCVLRIDSGEVTMYPAKNCQGGRQEDLAVSLRLVDVERRLRELFDEDEAAFETECERIEGNIEAALLRVIASHPAGERFDFVHVGDADDNPREYRTLRW